MILALTGGGTMGHISPNLALLPEFKKHFSKIIYIGSNGSMEQEQAKIHNIPFFAVPVIKFDRKHIFKNLKIPCVLKKATKLARQILKEQKVDVVFSKGGFVSVPVMLGAKKENIPYVLHESDMSLGLANKLGAKHATQIFVATEKTKNSLKNKYKQKTIVTGIPTKDEFKKSTTTPFMQSIKNKTNKKIMLVTGGSQGSKPINKIIRENLKMLTQKYHIIHITGKGNLDTSIKNKSYEQIEFTQNMPDFFKTADVIVARAGATTIFEALKSGTPMIVIPLPKSKFSRGDQIENAEYFESLGVLESIREENFSESSLLAALKSLEKNKLSLLKNIKEFNNSIPQNKTIAEIVSNIK